MPVSLHSASKNTLVLTAYTKEKCYFVVPSNHLHPPHILTWRRMRIFIAQRFFPVTVVPATVTVVASRVRFSWWRR